MPVRVKEDSGSAYGAAILASHGDISIDTGYTAYYPEDYDMYNNLYIKYRGMVKHMVKQDKS